MLTVECGIPRSDLPPDAAAALAEHDHLPDIVAADLGCFEDGCRGLRRDPAD